MLVSKKGSLLVAASVCALYSLPTHAHARHGMVFDVGVKGNLEYMSMGYVDRFEVPSASNATEYHNLFDANPIRVDDGPDLRPAVRVGGRYYFDRMFMGLHLEDTFIEKHTAQNYHIKFNSDPDTNAVHWRLKNTNSFAAELSTGYWLTDETAVVVGALATWDHYRSSYRVDEYANGAFASTAKVNRSFMLPGYGLSCGLERYLTDHVLLSLGYRFIRHNSHLNIRQGAPSPGSFTATGSFVDITQFDDHILSLGIVVEL